MTSKRLTSKSGIMIPKDVRLRLGWQPGMSVDMEVTDDGGLTLRSHVDRCRFCGNIENVRKYKDVCVCASCSAEMKEAV